MNKRISTAQNRAYNFDLSIETWQRHRYRDRPAWMEQNWRFWRKKIIIIKDQIGISPYLDEEFAIFFIYLGSTNRQMLVLEIPFWFDCEKFFKLQLSELGIDLLFLRAFVPKMRNKTQVFPTPKSDFISVILYLNCIHKCLMTSKRVLTILIWMSERA